VYRFALRPRWIISHLFVLLLVVTMVNLGLWQIRRLDERRDRNRVVEEHIARAPVPLGDLLTTGSDGGEVKDAAYRRVTVTGTYEPDDQVLVRGRSLEGNPGSWVLTPLRQADGSLVVVNRGWIANDGTYDAVPRSFAPAEGPVRVEGLVQEPQTRGSFGPKDPPTGRLTSLARVDVARYARQLRGDVVPAWIQLRSETPKPPASAAAPVVLGPPELDEGPHFSYAVQWFIFSLIAVVGYPLILRRNARERTTERIEPHEEELVDVEPDPAPKNASVPADGRA
jgi:cytochrome oxidase assembly protein ShyY1